jgi:malonyl CoA-acyl carrier protein transacylase
MIQQVISLADYRLLAIRWIESHASRDATALRNFATNQLTKKDYHDAIATIHRARTLTLDEGQKHQLDELTRSIDAEAAPGAAKYLPLN